MIFGTTALLQHFVTVVHRVTTLQRGDGQATRFSKPSIALYPNAPQVRVLNYIKHKLKTEENE